uniref:Uncharacterized protein n=1 Tax=Sphaerodactylus townsendi TaxID=933632 RepID=A0ACB8EE48_9SAUR
MAGTRAEGTAWLTVLLAASATRLSATTSEGASRRSNNGSLSHFGQPLPRVKPCHDASPHCLPSIPCFLGA